MPSDRPSSCLEHDVSDHPPVGRCILIVDDSVEYLNFMQLLLEAEGFRSGVVTSAAAMQEWLRTSTPDMIISDVCIPGESSFSVLDVLQADQRTSAIPLLLCTGAVQEVERQAERLQRSGVEILLKPFDIEVLIDKVVRLCATQSVPQL